MPICLRAGRLYVALCSFVCPSVCLMSADYLPSQNSEHLLVFGVQENLRYSQWRRQDFVTGGSEVWVYRGSRVRSPSIPVVLSVYQRGSLLDRLAMYLLCDTKKFHDNESTHTLHNVWTSTHRRGKLLPSPPGGATCYSLNSLRK